MTVRTVSNLPAAMHVETARCLFAIELSKQSWVIGFITPLSAKISRRILSGGDWKGLLDLIEEVRARVSRETGRTVDVISCYEAGYDGFWLHRLLEAHGIRNYAIDPASLQTDRRARRVKTDRIDTERLLRSARSLPQCWLARYSIVNSTIAANWRVMSATRRARFRAETWPITKRSARPATARGEPPGSNSPGCGCAISPTAI